MATILIIDDEEDILDLVSLQLKRQGYETLTAADGLRGLEIAQRKSVDLIVLDLMLPEMDGLTVQKSLRSDSRTRHIPVLMLTAKAQQSDKINGLETGADDYMTKPFSPRELVLRISNLLRRAGEIRHVSEIKVDDFTLDLKNLKLFVGEAEISLTTTEFKLMHLMMENVDKVRHRANLLAEVWGYPDEVHTRTLDTHMKRLREKLGPHGLSIRTVRGVGYRMVSAAGAAEEDAANTGPPPPDRGVE